ncbi:MAG: tripartite tricarboxylate transporter substrate binding protein [Betaproteobacteria bacterium]|nr:tripartite tricarboxylate transporter substrate binding protein [Betaproteobacteria bacterium]
MFVILAFQPAVHAQSYPSKPVRIVTSQPGGTSAFVARMLAQGLAGPLGQQVIVDNRVAVIAIEAVAKAPPDGYTLLVMSNLLWMLPLLQSTSFDPVKDFLPVSLTATSPNILVVHPSLPVKSVKQLITLAKARPGELNFATSGTGASNHLAAELFKAMAGIDIVRINYRGGGPLLIAMLGGEVPISFASAGAVAPHLKAARLRALAVTSAHPSALLPGLPPVAETLPGYETVAMYGVFAPAGTPAAIISRLNQEIARFLRTPEAKERFLSTGMETVGNSASEFGAAMKSDLSKMAKVIKEANIQAQ